MPVDEMTQFAIMVTRRSTQTNRNQASAAARRRQRHRAAAKDKTLYVGGDGSGGGHVGNVAGLGGGEPPRYNDVAPRINNVAGYGVDSADVTPRRGRARRRASYPDQTPRGAKAPTRRKPRPGSGAVMSRRAFLFGVGALAIVGAGAVVVAQVVQDGDDEEDSGVSYLEVPEDAVTSSNDSTEVEVDDHMTLLGSYELPYGTLMWNNDDVYAACLLPTETSSPLTQVGLFSLASGTYSVVLEQAVGADEGFEVFDVRATSSGLVWTESDILDGTWRIYTAALSGGVMGAPVLAAEGDTVDWDTPTITAVGAYAFWLVKPKSSGDKYSEGSTFMRVGMGGSDSQVVYHCRGRMATRPYGLADSVVIAPRLDSSTVYYQLTLIDAESCEVLDTMTLPYSMTPLEAGYGKTGFMFSFEDIYSYGDGIANLGTYTPLQAVDDGAYSDAPWFHFYRTPTVAPAWCGSYFMVKSTTKVCGFDFTSGEYFAFDTESGCDDYGEYLATTGIHDQIVTYTNVDDDPIEGDTRQCCVVKVWTCA